jgi:hypothetical protein
MLALDKLVHRELLKVGLDHHWVPEHITSSIYPMGFNDNRVSWVGVRYAKAKTVQYIKEMKLSTDGLGFPKYACIQFCLVDRAFEINLFHSVKNNAVDRDYLYGQLRNKDFAERLVREIESLKGNGLVWHIAGVEPFEIDARDAEDFLTFYKQDSEGRESCLVYSISPDDNRLRSESSICETIIEKAITLMPLLEIVSKSWGI